MTALWAATHNVAYLYIVGKLKHALPNQMVLLQLPLYGTAELSMACDVGKELALHYHAAHWQALLDHIQCTLILPVL